MARHQLCIIIIIIIQICVAEKMCGAGQVQEKQYVILK